MMIGGISGTYAPYRFSGGVDFARQAQSGFGNTRASAVQSVGQGASAQRAGYNPAVLFSSADGTVSLRIGQAQEADDFHKVKGGYKSSPADCKTCKERKYQDGSDEADVSFKTPGHISPQASASTVMAHEQQHVANAYQKAAEKDGQVVSCNVSLHTAVCPECGTVYVSGGTTRTAISYPDEQNPYQQNKKAQDAFRKNGTNINDAA